MLASVVMFVISACSWLREDSAGYEKVSASATLTSDYLVDYVDTSGSVDLTYTLNLGSATKDVFFVFTNTSATKDVEAPYSLSVSGVSSDFEASSLLNKQDVSGGSRPESGKPEITEFNMDVAKRLSENPVSASSYSASVLYPETLTPSASSVGDNESFCINTSGATVSATCRKVVTVGTKTLNVFVANDCWHATATKTYEITQAMVDAYASKFLSDGTNDIYGLVTGIYGSEWGTNTYSSSLISAGNAGNITILLYDIDGDDSSNGGTLGYFWAKDNYLKS